MRTRDYLLAGITGAWALWMVLSLGLGVGTSHREAEGRPAIPPHAPAKRGQPAFTPEDVLAYLNADPPRYGYATPLMPDDVTIEFLTAAEFEARLATAVDRRPSALLCLVTVRGAPIQGRIRELVFDARTGNVLMWSGSK
jgi:hypothetical protein